MSDTDLIREALGAYASALRSGEPESERMRMTRAELSEAIPPAMTDFIGLRLMQHVRARAAA